MNQKLWDAYKQALLGLQQADRVLEEASKHHAVAEREQELARETCKQRRQELLDGAEQELVGR